MSYGDTYADYWDANLKGIPYQYEPILMHEGLFEQAMREAKQLSWLVFDETTKLHKRSAKKHKMVKITSVDIQGGTLMLSFSEKDISKLSAREKERHIERIKAYKNNHPEKCYLIKLIQN